jgi:excisionase family DNA binding protein
MLSTPHATMAISVEQAARTAGLGRTLLYSLITSGELPSVKIGKRRLIRVEALARWLASQEQPGGRDRPPAPGGQSEAT